ncbi:MAG: tRNA (cytidine(56)-2'-O)-methyltransferase [archaeon]
MVKEITIIRYGHREERDKRVTSHCCLVARAFGAKRIIVCGPKDKGLEKSFDKVNLNWGKGTSLGASGNWKAEIRKQKARGAKIVHLTMYGIPLGRQIEKIRKEKKVAVLIGSQKVPREAYGLADYNVSVTMQPHSEVAALAVFLHELMQGKELEAKFRGAKIEVVPQERGKKTKKRF